MEYPDPDKTYSVDPTADPSLIVNAADLDEATQKMIFGFVISDIIPKRDRPFRPVRYVEHRPAKSSRGYLAYGRDAVGEIEPYKPRRIDGEDQARPADQ